MSFMKKHQARCKAGEQTVQTKTVQQVTARNLSGLGAKAEMERHHEMIMEDVKLLKEIKSIEQRKVEKKEAMKKYLPYIDAYLSQEKRYPNPVLVVMMIWAFDTKQIEPALKYAQECIKAGDEMPKEKGLLYFKSTVTEFALDELHDYLEEQYKAGNSSEPYLSDTIQFMDTLDVYDQIKAKYLKLKGRYLMDSEDIEELEMSLALFNRAMDLDSKVGCKTDRDTVEKKVKKLKVNQPEPTGETNSEDTPNGDDSGSNEADAS